MATSAAPATTWRFPCAFWTANIVELFERAAYYIWYYFAGIGAAATVALNIYGWLTSKSAGVESPEGETSP